MSPTLGQFLRDYPGLALHRKQDVSWSAQDCANWFSSALEAPVCVVDGRLYFADEHGPGRLIGELREIEVSA